MRPSLLILGGTSEATALATKVADAGLTAMFSYAGRVDSPRAQPIPLRSGGFGGAQGLADYLTDNKITHLIDATHPFAAQISRNAIDASAATGVPLLALTRPAWPTEPLWTHVSDMQSAVQAIDTEAKRVFLGIGRMDADQFLTQPQHHYLLRFVDMPETPPRFPDHLLVLARGPFALADEIRLLRTHRIDLVVSKNSGGDGARAKLDAARALDIPILMIDRPTLPPRQEVDKVSAVMDWLSHTDLGV